MHTTCRFSISDGYYVGLPPFCVLLTECSAGVLGNGTMLSDTRARTVWLAFVAAVGRMDRSLKPSDSYDRLRRHAWTKWDLQYVFLTGLALFWLWIMQEPEFPLKIMIPILYGTSLAIPFTSQFFLPAAPILSWVLTFFTSRWIPISWRPSRIYITVLPTLETVLYGANLSDILTRRTHPVLDVLAWLPYGVVHFVFPFVVALSLWLFKPKKALHFWGRAFGYMNLVGVMAQLFFPTAPPWYEIRNGLLPADYTMKGSPGGLARIDRLLGVQMYTNVFSNAPVPFGAFPALHAGSATIEALFVSHFFPEYACYIWTYAMILYWSTLYLHHHYFIDVVAGACLATATFHLFLPDDLRQTSAATVGPRGRDKYALYDLEAPARRSGMADSADFDLSDEFSDEEQQEDITYRSPVPGVTFSIPTGGGGLNVSKTGNGNGQVPRKSHRHTASIASLMRAEERGEDGWSPMSTLRSPFVFPPRHKD